MSSASANEIVRLWAEDTEGEREKRFSSVPLKYYGNRLVSYSTKIAERYKDDNGHPLIVLTYYNYSSTTVKHKSLVRQMFPDFVTLLMKETEYRSRIADHIFATVKALENSQAYNDEEKPYSEISGFIEEWMVLAFGIRKVYTRMKKQLRKELDPETTKKVKDIIKTADRISFLFKEARSSYFYSSGLGFSINSSPVKSGWPN